MAQIKPQPILSLCIPIYNRQDYLQRQLERFLEDRDLFVEDIHLFISDMHSDIRVLVSCLRTCKQINQDLHTILY